MPSISPSPAKRPSLTQRTSSNNSLSSSNKPAQKASRSHLVARHGRNPSYGKGLARAGKVQSSSNLVGEGARNHKRNKSSTDATSPKQSAIKRNSSHVALAKNNSHVALRKNKSANALARNNPHTVLKKSGLGHPPKKSKDKANFDLADDSSDIEEQEENAEWEDTNTISPEMTRDNSAANTRPSSAAQIKPLSNQSLPPEKPPDLQKVSDPPQASINAPKKSAPDMLRQHSEQREPALLHQQPKIRAPPALSSISAQAAAGQLPRNNSTRSFQHVTHAEVLGTPNTLKNQSGPGNSSSADGGVSHFLPASSPRVRQLADEGSDSDSPSSFLPNYHPQIDSSARKPSQLSLPSRTQQRLELQRRETLRASLGAQPSPSGPENGFRYGSSGSLHSRSGSRSRARTAAGDAKLVRKEYENATKQLNTIRRFRNPLVEAMNRLKESGALPGETGTQTPGSQVSKRPPSRRGLTKGIKGHSRNVSRSFETKVEEAVPQPKRGSKVQFQRQGSHDDISRSRNSYEDGEQDESNGAEGGLSAEEALVRRMWESGAVYRIEDSPEH